MGENNLFIKLIALLDKFKSKTRIQQDIQQLEKTPFYLRLIAALNKNKSRTKINQDLKEIGSNQTINVKAKVDRNSAVKSLDEVKQSLQNETVNINAEINAPVDSLNEAKEAQEDIVESGKGIKGVVTSYVSWHKILELVSQAARKAVDTVKDLAKAQTDLQVVSGKSNSEMQHMMKSYNQLAQDLSSTTTDVTSAADEWLRQGKTISETNELIQGSVVLSKIGQLEASESTEYLTSALNGYKLEASDTIKVVDRLSAVDLESATNAGGLAEAMSKCANGARIAGVSMDSLIGYIATVSDVTQKSASVVGESFKTMFSRMGKVKIGNFIDDDGTDMTEQINDVEAILSKFDIKLRDSANEFRNFEEVIYDVGVSFDKFTTVEKNAIAAGFGGVYQRENVLTLFENFDKVLKLTEVSANSAGTAMEKFAVYENGLEAATNRLTASFESLAYNTIDSEFMENLANATASIVEYVDKTKLVQTSLTALSYTAAIKGLLLLGTKMVAVKNNAVAMSNAMALSTMTTKRNAQQNTLLGNSFKQLTAQQQKLLLSNKKLTNEQRISILMSTGMSRATAKAKLQAMGFTTAANGAASATFNLRGAWEALKLSIASNPLGLVITALTTTTMLIQSHIQKQEELHQEIKENAEQARETSKEIFDLYNQYNDLSEAVLTDASNKEQLTSVTDTLLEKLGYEKSAIKSLTEEYGDLDTAIKSVTLESLKTEWDKLLLDYGETEKELEKLLPAKALANGTRNINIKNDKGLDDYDDTIKLLEDSGIFDEILKPSAGGDGYSNPNITFRLADGYNGAEGAKALYDTVAEVVQLLNSTYSSDELLDNAVYKEFVNLQETLSAKITEFDTSVSGVNTNLAQQQIIMSLMNKDIPDTVDEFESYKDTLINSALANDSFVGTEEDIRKAVESSLASMPEFAEFFEVTADTIVNDTIPSITDLTTAYKSLSEALDEIYDKQDKLTEVFEKIASGAKLTAREVLELVEDFPNIMEYITQDGDGYTISAYNRDLLTYQLEEEAKAQGQSTLDWYEQQKRYLTDKLNKLQYGSVDVNSYKTRGSEIQAVKDELAELAVQAGIAQDVIDKLVEIDTRQTYLDSISERYDNATSSIKDYNSSISTIDDAIQKMNEGQALTYDEMIALVEISPKMADSITEQEDGYYTTVDALKDLREESKKARNAYIQDQIKMERASLNTIEAERQAIVTRITSASMAEYYSNALLENAEAQQKVMDNIAMLEEWMNEVYSNTPTGSSNDPITTAFEKELKYLDYLRDMGMISAKEYYKQLYFLNEKYYSDNADYLEQYRDNEVKIRDGITDIEIRAIDRQIEALEALKEKREEEKELQELQIELEEKKLELLNKQSQKNVRYYDAEKREWVWTYNRNDVADAQKAVDEAQEALDEHLYQSNEDKKIEQLEQIKEILQGDEDNPNNPVQFVGSEGVTTQATGRLVTFEEFVKSLGATQPIDTTKFWNAIYSTGLQPNVQKIAESTHNQNYQTVNRNVTGNTINVTVNGSNLSADELSGAIENGVNDALMDLANQLWLKS